MILELEQVTRTYPGTPPARVLAGVSLAVATGELVAVTGPSGSGKTTLLRLMAGQDRASTGTIRIAGQDVTTLRGMAPAGPRAPGIGFVPEEPCLTGRASALDNVAGGLPRTGAALAVRRDRAAGALARVGLGTRLAARPDRLSRGERQRVAIARAVVGRPAIVLADDPTGHLDGATARSVLGLLIELHGNGATVVIVTYDEAVAARLPRRVELGGGRIVADTAPPAPAEWPRPPR